MLVAHEAVRGRAKCARCECVIDHDGEKKTVLVCGGCGWTGTWGAYLGSLKGRRMAAGGLHPTIEAYHTRYPRLRTTREKMVQIDALIHRFHHELEKRWGPLFGWNLIEGTGKEIQAFLNDLTYGEQSTAALVHTRDVFKKRLQEQEQTRRSRLEKKELNRARDRRRRREAIGAIETHGRPAPEWAPRLPQKLIRKLYESDARGFRDEVLVDEVGYAILARIDSIITATESAQGRVKCPTCSNHPRSVGWSRRGVRVCVWVARHLVCLPQELQG